MDHLAVDHLFEVRRQVRVLFDHGDGVRFLREHRGQVAPDFPRSDDDDIHEAAARVNRRAAGMLIIPPGKGNAQGSQASGPHFLLCVPRKHEL